jgi:hypothetical protein
MFLPLGILYFFSDLISRPAYADLFTTHGEGDRPVPPWLDLPARDLTQFVNPLIGTEGFGHGPCPRRRI